MFTTVSSQAGVCEECKEVVCCRRAKFCCQCGALLGLNGIKNANNSQNLGEENTTVMNVLNENVK
jgi:hypothetical protein